MSERKFHFLSLLIILCLLLLSLYSLNTKDINTRGSNLDNSNQRLLAFYNATIIDGTGAKPIEDGVVLVEGERIKKLGKSNQIKIPKGATKINLKGKTLLPGFINAHVHHAYTEDNLKNWLNAGVTTVRDLSPQIDAREAIARRDKFNQRTDLARVISASPILGVPGGYGNATFHSLAEAKEMVNGYIDDNIDIIKFAITDFDQNRSWEMPTFEQVKAIVDTAHARGIKTSVHITNTEYLQWVVKLGVDDIAHMVLTPLNDKIIKQIVDKNIYLLPTLEVWNRVGRIYHLNYNFITRMNLAKFYKAGGKVALGTDFGGYECTFDSGFPITEVKLMKKAGMSNMDIIVAGTKNGAFVSDREEDLGTLEEGKIADILIVSGNPLKDIETLEETYMVVHNGEIVLNKEEN
ncbi:amidohydrolase family protein [Orenia marismortui]|uniref:amidohydrolase family protein n=1 Tax=Orenia marismortui TaxID=46469 RepID=UPI0003680585|nr:amidohydrolase family protein [Orenia marismortui]